MVEGETAVKLVEKGYNKIYERYNKQRTGNRREIKNLAKLLHKNAVVLDVGCGSGYITRLLTDVGFEVVGTDISSGMLRLAKKNAPTAKFYRMDMRRLRFRKHAFDAITSFYAIIHVPRRYHQSIFKEFNTLLMPGGVLLISVGGTESRGDIEENWRGYGSAMYWSHFGIRKNLQLIREAGFRIIWHRFVGPKNDRHPVVLAQKPDSR